MAAGGGREVVGCGGTVEGRRSLVIIHSQLSVEIRRLTPVSRSEMSLGGKRPNRHFRTVFTPPVSFLPPHSSGSASQD